MRCHNMKNTHEPETLDGLCKRVGYLEAQVDYLFEKNARERAALEKDCLIAKDWEKEFDEQFGEYQFHYESTKKNIKSFISKTIVQEVEKDREISNIRTSRSLVDPIYRLLG